MAIGVETCPRCGGRLRMTAVVVDPDAIAAALRVGVLIGDFRRGQGRPRPPKGEIHSAASHPDHAARVNDREAFPSRSTS